MKEEILTEISNFCSEECPSCTCCPEEECVLFRIEKIVCESPEVKEEKDSE